MTRVAVAQVGSKLFDTEGTLDRLRDLVQQAADEQVEFLVFHEAFLGGYPKGLDFRARVGSRTPEGRDDFQRCFDTRGVRLTRRPLRRRNLLGKLHARSARCWPVRCTTRRRCLSLTSTSVRR